MLKCLDSYDWTESFQYAQAHRASLTAPKRQIDIDIEDVQQVFGQEVEAGDYAETSTYLVFSILDPEDQSKTLYCYLTAGCDTTGWD